MASARKGAEHGPGGACRSKVDRQISPRQTVGTNLHLRLLSSGSDPNRLALKPEPEDETGGDDETGNDTLVEPLRAETRKQD